MRQPSNLPSNKTFLLVVVISKPSSIRHRVAYRETVLSPIRKNCLPDTKHLFLVGMMNNRELQTRLDVESEEHGDILQGNFLDTYNNLTIKCLFMIQWVATNCPHIQYVLKIDDDVFTILDDAKNYLMNNVFANYTISGSIFRNVKPILDSNKKWNVAGYTDSVFPTYVSGTAYVLSQRLLGPLFKAAMSIPFIRLEDVFITGVAARATNLSIDYHEFPGFQYGNNREGFNLAILDFERHKSVHGMDERKLRFLHKRLQNARHTQCFW